jgi:hypothetical protein
VFSTVLLATVFDGSTDVEICSKGGVFLDRSKNGSSSDSLSLAELSVTSCVSKLTKNQKREKPFFSKPASTALRQLISHRWLVIECSSNKTNSNRAAQRKQYFAQKNEASRRWSSGTSYDLSVVPMRNCFLTFSNLFYVWN